MTEQNSHQLHMGGVVESLERLEAYTLQTARELIRDTWWHVLLLLVVAGMCLGSVYYLAFDEPVRWWKLVLAGANVAAAVSCGFTIGNYARMLAHFNSKLTEVRRLLHHARAAMPKQ